MKKVTITLFSAFFAGTMVFSQENVFNVGDKVVNIGIGVGSTIGYSVHGTIIPPVCIKVDYGVKEGLGPGIIGIGGIIGTEKYGWSNSYESWSYSSFIIGGSGTYHMPLVDKLDTYGGLSMGIRVTKHSYKYPDYPEYNDNDIYPGLFSALFVGARYYFTENIGVMAELGWDIAWLKVGASIKF